MDSQIKTETQACEHEWTLAIKVMIQKRNWKKKKRDGMMEYIHGESVYKVFS